VHARGRAFATTNVTSCSAGVGTPPTPGQRAESLLPAGRWDRSHRATLARSSPFLKFSLIMYSSFPYRTNEYITSPPGGVLASLKFEYSAPRAKVRKPLGGRGGAPRDATALTSSGQGLAKGGRAAAAAAAAVKLLTTAD